MSTRKVLVIGLDCAPPELIFHRFRDDLPTIRQLMQTGVYGPLNSTIPPITVPAWMSMMTGKDPGTLGFYGFRNRADYAYSRLSIANSTLVNDDAVWDILSAAGKKVILVGVPQTYPPRAVNGCMIASFLTPSTNSAYTYPPSLKSEIERVADSYVLDVRDFRTEDKARLLRDIYTMTEKRFRVTRHLLQTRDWDFCMHVEMGTDRIHHGFWRFLDPAHRKYEPHSDYQNAIRDYYRYLDREIATLIDLAGQDAVILLVSDHGAKRIDGGICINEWLIREGYLTPKKYPQTPTALEDLEIDWTKTIAWGAGGYYARIFLNIAGREPTGIVPPEHCDALCDELAAKIKAIPDDRGHPLPTRVFKPKEIYHAITNIPPELIIYFGDLLWRSVGTIGHRTIHTLENDTGPDDANHAQHGIFILNDGTHAGEREHLDIRDIAPTILGLMGMPIPTDMQGHAIVNTSATPAQAETRPSSTGGAVYTPAEQKAIEDRLKALGYL